MGWDNPAEDCRYANVCPQSVTCGSTPKNHMPCYVYESKLDKFFGRVFNSHYDWNIYHEYKAIEKCEKDRIDNLIKKRWE